MREAPQIPDNSGRQEGGRRAVQTLDTSRDTRIDTYVGDPQGYGPYGDEDTKTFDVYKYLRIATKYKWLIAGIALAILSVTAVSNFMTTPIYKATSSIQIDREATKILDKGGVESSDNAGMDFYQTQYELLKSRSLAERVASALSLGNDPAFNKRLAPSILSIVISKVRGLIFSDGDPSETSTSGGGSAEDRNQSAVFRLMGGLETQPVRGSRIVAISFSHPDPAVAQRVANGYGRAPTPGNSLRSASDSSR
ncbi:MAG: Wzz/FepE/Etk N-terminal domain-containing protein [Alphaproteobacteria bacterium]|nr:Wzz/FepE/Etk N-terminal domain-containing protein [Alphaproteobacteria bacterium]